MTSVISTLTTAVFLKRYNHVDDFRIVEVVLVKNT